RRDHARDVRSREEAQRDIGPDPANQRTELADAFYRVALTVELMDGQPSGNVECPRFVIEDRKLDVEVAPAAFGMRKDRRHHSLGATADQRIDDEQDFPLHLIPPPRSPSSFSVSFPAEVLEELRTVYPSQIFRQAWRLLGQRKSVLEIYEH